MKKVWHIPTLILLSFTNYERLVSFQLPMVVALYFQLKAFYPKVIFQYN